MDGKILKKEKIICEHCGQECATEEDKIIFHRGCRLKQIFEHESKDGMLLININKPLKKKK